MQMKTRYTIALICLRYGLSFVPVKHVKGSGLSEYVYAIYDMEKDDNDRGKRNV